MNWGGRAAGAEQYAMHGLLLDQAFTHLEQTSTAEITGRLKSHDFGGRWPSRADISVTWRLADGGLRLQVDVSNVGDEAMPLGIGWHPYWRLPSGRRDQARVRVPASARLRVNNYDGVLPTGEVAAIAGGPYDVAQAGGLLLGGLHLDDCFTGLTPAPDGVVAEVLDPAGDLRISLAAISPAIRAVQVYAPPDRAIVVVEPQFNWPDPFGAVWKGADTGMVRLEPGGRAQYAVSVAIAALGPRQSRVRRIRLPQAGQ
jgi:aldose 1-epimerase